MSVLEDIDFCFFAMLLTLAQLTFMFFDTFNLIPPKGVNQGLPSFVSVFGELKLCFKDIDAGFLTNFYHF